MDRSIFPTSARSTVRRHAERGSADRALVYGILDEGLVCHVAFVDAEWPVIIPMAYARRGDRLLLHGSPASRLLGRLSPGVEACVAVTLVDGLVLARSLFHSSMNYRSVVAFGWTRRLDDDAERRTALEAIAEHLTPGRLVDARAMTDREVAATAIVEFVIEEATAKVRRGPPRDPIEDVGLPLWAGVVPLALTAGVPEPAPDLPDGIAPPRYASGYARPEPTDGTRNAGR